MDTLKKKILAFAFLHYTSLLIFHVPFLRQNIFLKHDTFFFTTYTAFYIDLLVISLWQVTVQSLRRNTCYILVQIIQEVYSISPSPPTYHNSDPYKASDGIGYFRIYFQVPVQ